MIEKQILSNTLEFKPEVFHKLMKDAERYESGSMDNLLHLGETYFMILSMRPWRHDGTGARDITEWISRELRRKKSTVYNIINLWKECDDIFRERPALKSTPPSHIYLLLPYMNDKNREDLVHVANTTDLAGIKDYINELKGRPTTYDCAHEKMELWYRCPDCGKFMKGAN